MQYFTRFTMEKNVINGKMAKYAANICAYVAADFDDDYERIFWCTSFHSTDWEMLTYNFDTDYNERFTVHFDFNKFSVQVMCKSNKEKLLIKRFDIEPTVLLPDKEC